MPATNSVRLRAGEYLTVVQADAGWTGYQTADFFRSAGRVILSGGAWWQAEALLGGWLVVNDATGVLDISDRGTPIYGVVPPHHLTGVIANSLVNDGLTTVRGVQDALGVWTSQMLLNRGELRVDAKEFGYGALVTDGGFVNTGLIEVTAGYQAIGLETRDQALHENFGRIVARATEPGGVSIAYFASENPERTDLMNAGVLEGDYAYFAYAGGGLATIKNVVDAVYNAVGGEMRGAVYTAFGDDAVINRGLITGPVFLAHQNDVFDGSAGIQTSYVDGGDGADLLIGGISSDSLYGGEHADVIRGGGGDDLIEGGRGDDVLDGGDGFDTLSYLGALGGVTVDLSSGTATGQGTDRVSNFEDVLGSVWNDVITGSATDNILEGVAGDDRLTGGKGDDILIGGTGADTLAGGLGADTFIVSAGDGSDEITDFDGTDALRVHGFTQALSIVQVGADTLVTLSATDTILLRGVDAASLTGARLVFNAAPLAAEPTGPFNQSIVTAHDVVIGVGERLVLDDPSFSDGGNDVFASAAILTTDWAHSRQITSVWNAGEVSLHVTSARGPVSGIASTRNDYGDGTAHSGRTLVHNQATGSVSVVNDGTTDTWGIYAGSDPIWNDGDVSAIGGGDVKGVWGGRLYNTGSIQVQAGGVGWGANVEEFWNTGLIEVDSHLAGAGVLGYSSSLVFNGGTIRVTDDTAAIDSMGISYDLASGGMLLNTGVIEADFAIRYGSISNNHSDGDYSVQTIFNSGELRGRVSTRENGDAVYNSGLITGLVELLNGNDVFYGRGGVQQGGVDGGDGDDVLHGGSEADRLIGGVGRDVLAGGGGVDQLTGGAGADEFRYYAGDGADVITDFGGDVVVFGGYSAWQSIEQVGADVLIRLSATDTLTLRNFTVEQVLASPTRFTFNAAAVAPGPAGAPQAPDRPSPTAPPTSTGPAVIAPIAGGDGDDQLVGTAADDLLLGGGGADRLTDGDGSDTLLGGLGGDIFVFGRVTAGPENDRVLDFNPGEGDLIYLAGQASDWVISDGYARSGEHIITFGMATGFREALRFGAPGAGVAPAPTGLVFAGTSGRDVRTGSGLADTLDGLDDMDALDGGGGDDLLRGGAGDDLLSGGTGADRLEGGAGDDNLAGGAGDDSLTGGDGLDVADYHNASAAIRVDLALSVQDTLGAGRDTFVSIEGVSGSAFADTLFGTSGANILAGGAGDDRLEGRGGADILVGGAGEDTAVFAGARSAYTLTWTINDADGVVVTGPDGVAKVVDVEWLQFSDQRVSALQPRLNYVGTAGNDTRNGTHYHDTFDGGAGNDILNGLYGDDVMHGGLGDDQLTAGVGNHKLYGDEGNDVLLSRPAAAGGTNTAPSRTAIDVLLDGGAGDDRIDFTVGGVAIDTATIYGGDGADTLSGSGAFSIRIYGGAGDDTILCRQLRGQMKVQGGEGRDTFRISPVDRTGPYYAVAGIEDFKGGPGGDVIDLLGALQALNPNISLDQDLFEAGLVKVVQRDIWIDIMILGENGYWNAASLTNINAWELTSDNFLGAIPGRHIPFDMAGYASNDTITGTDMVNQVWAGAGDDVVRGLGGNDRLAGEAGHDTLYGDAGDDRLEGGIGTDTLNGGDGNDYLDAGGHHDGMTGLVYGRGDHAFGGAGDDVLFGASPGGHLFGGTGNDIYHGAMVAHENANEGADTVLYDWTGRTLEANIETLLLSYNFTTGLVAGWRFDTYEARTGRGNVLDNRIVGASGIDTLWGMDGNDRLEGLVGNDLLYGQNGDDVLVGGLGSNRLDGGEGTDTVVFSRARSAYTITVGSGVTTIVGPDGTDTLYSVEKLQFLDGLFDGAGNPLPIQGGAGADVLTGFAGVDTIEGFDGADVLSGAGGNDVIDGGAGVDVAVFSETGARQTAVTVGGVTTVTGPDGVDTLRNVETLRFGGVDLAVVEGETLILGAEAGETVQGSAGGDRLFGRGGDDILIGGAGADRLDGGAGVDRADYGAAAGGVTATLAGGQATNDGDGGADTLAGIEHLTGSAFNDSLTGDGGANDLVGGGGADVLIGLGADDTLRGDLGNDGLQGGDGDDILVGGAGVDILNGGAGVDTADYSAAAAGMRAQLNSNSSSNDGEGGTDTFSGIENLTGSAFNDTLIGDAAVNLLRGGLGADVLLGLAGNDVLWGGSGALNQLQGGLGDDYYVLEANDSVVEVAGEGADTIEARINAYVLALNVENLVFGGTGDFAATGNAQNNAITGGAGDDNLRGRGGVDVLNGGAGTDTVDYTLAAAGVTARLDTMRATNDGDGATDTFSNVENLTGSIYNDLLIGNAGNNVLKGGIGTDTLLGFGGDDILWGGSGGGNNQLQGGTGNDYYILDAFDTCVELAGEGIDTVEARIGSYTMGANIENLLYVGGTGTFVGTGNTLDNHITGGNGNDILRGRGGNDVIDGGLGKDEIQLRGLAANYTITAEGAGWRIVDLIAGRDGSTFVTSIEVVRFSNNALRILTYPPVAAGIGEPADKGPGPQVSPLLPDELFGKDGDAFVLPALGDDLAQVLPGLDPGKGGDAFEVLPAIADKLFLGLEHQLAQHEGWMLTLDPDGPFGGRDGHDWLG